MTENINKLIFSELIFELLHKNKNLKKIKLSMFCKTRLCVIRKKNINIDLLNLLYYIS